MIKKKLFFGLLAASLAVMALAVLVTLSILGTGHLRVRTPDFSLSFKEFTLQELLMLDVEVDVETCGEKLQSEELETLTERVSSVRELSLEKPVEFRECSESVVRFELTGELAEEESMQDIEAAQKMLVALGLFPESGDLEETLTDVYTEQIAGSYNLETKMITIVEGKGTGSLMDEVTLAHEVTHALQDQHFHLEDPPLDHESYNGDNLLAIESLVEGDAMFTMFEYAMKFVDIEALMDEEMTGTEVSSEELDNAPTYIQESLMFPYEEGYEFVMTLVEDKGLEGLDDAFAEPPLSTEQIMHPDKYITKNDPPRVVEVPDISGSLGEDWDMLDSDSLGEFDVQVWFGEYLPAAAEISTGWGGNTIQYYQGPEDSYVMVNSFLWDTPEDASEFFRGYRELLEERFPDAREVEGAEGSFILEDGGDYYYCGLNSDATLCVQATGRDALEDALRALPR